MMKLVSGVVLTEMGGITYLAAAGEAGKNFNGMMKLNSTAAFITGLLKEDTDENALVTALLNQYDVNEETARKNVRQVIRTFTENGLIED